jgi:hypothetical protein
MMARFGDGERFDLGVLVSPVLLALRQTWHSPIQVYVAPGELAEFSGAQAEGDRVSLSPGTRALQNTCLPAWPATNAGKCAALSPPAGPSPPLCSEPSPATLAGRSAAP